MADPKDIKVVEETTETAVEETTEKAAEEVVEEKIAEEAVEESDSTDTVGPMLLSTELSTFEEWAQDDRWTKAPCWLRDAYEMLLGNYRAAVSEADELRKITALFPEYIEAMEPGTDPSVVIEAVFDEYVELSTVREQITVLLDGGRLSRDDVDSVVVIGVAQMRNAYVRLIRLVEQAGQERELLGVAEASKVAPTTEPNFTVHPCPAHMGQACALCGGSGQVRVV